MDITKATLEDIKTLEDLNDKFFHENGRDWEKLVSGKNSEMFLLEENHNIIGFTGLSYSDWNGTARIINIFVHPDHRKKGYGSQLIKYLQNYLKNKNYRTLIAEAPSLNSVLSVYLKNSFRICGFNDRYYSNDGKEIAIFLSYDLD